MRKNRADVSALPSGAFVTLSVSEYNGGGTDGTQTSAAGAAAQRRRSGRRRVMGTILAEALRSSQGGAPNARRRVGKPNPADVRQAWKAEAKNATIASRVSAPKE